MVDFVRMRLLHVPLDSLRLVGASLGPKGLVALCYCCKSSSDIVIGKPFEEIWRSFSGECKEPLLSNEPTPMRRCLQLAAVVLNGTWYDQGTDIASRERYHFLTAVKETKREGLERIFEGVSQLERNQLKLSQARISGASYFCTERYVHERTGRIDGPVMNVGRGTLDLRDPAQPCIRGTWEQLELPRLGLRRYMAQVAKGMPPPATAQRLTDGSFVFKRISCTSDGRPWENLELREMAGLGGSAELYVVTPLGDEVDDPGVCTHR